MIRLLRTGVEVEGKVTQLEEVTDLLMLLREPIELAEDYRLGDLLRLLDIQDVIVLEAIYGSMQPWIEESKQPAVVDDPMVELVIQPMGSVDRETQTVKDLVFDISGRTADGQCVGISLVPTNHMADCPLRFDGSVVIDRGEVQVTPPIDLYIMLGDLIGAVFDEITWYGSPAERDEIAAELRRRQETVADTDLTAEEVFAKLNVNADDDDEGSGSA